MSSYHDYVISSNNSINDNKVNAKKARSVGHQFKRLLRPLFTILKKQNKNTYRKNLQPNYFVDEFQAEIEDNNANELLEAKIFDEIDTCDDFAGVPVYDGRGHLDILPIFRGQRYIPVNFAKTEAGTFFWTTLVAPDVDIDCRGDKNAFSARQEPALQVPRCDRWAQA